MPISYADKLVSNSKSIRNILDKWTLRDSGLHKIKNSYERILKLGNRLKSSPRNEIEEDNVIFKLTKNLNLFIDLVWLFEGRNNSKDPSINKSNMERINNIRDLILETKKESYERSLGFAKKAKVNFTEIPPSAQADVASALVNIKESGLDLEKSMHKKILIGIVKMSLRKKDGYVDYQSMKDSFRVLTELRRLEKRINLFEGLEFPRESKKSCLSI